MNAPGDHYHHDQRLDVVVFHHINGGKRACLRILDPAGGYDVFS